MCTVSPPFAFPRVDLMFCYLLQLPIMNIRSFKKRSILQLDQDQIKLYLNDMRTFKLTFDNRSSGMQQPQQQSLRRTQIASAPREKDSDLVYSYIRR